MAKKSRQTEPIHDVDSDPQSRQLQAGGRTPVYYPVLHQITGDTKAALLLAQMMFWYINQKRKPFYKFIQPCGHPLYREGDSWMEEMGWSKDEFIGARNKIATRVKKNELSERLRATSPCFGPSSDGRCKDKTVLTNSCDLVYYYDGGNNTTYYCLNEALLQKALECVSQSQMTENPISDVGNSDFGDDVLQVPYNREDCREDDKADNLKESSKELRVAEATPNFETVSDDSVKASAWRPPHPNDGNKEKLNEPIYEIDARTALVAAELAIIAALRSELKLDLHRESLRSDLKTLVEKPCNTPDGKQSILELMANEPLFEEWFRKDLNFCYCASQEKEKGKRKYSMSAKDGLTHVQNNILRFYNYKHTQQGLPVDPKDFRPAVQKPKEDDNITVVYEKE